MVYFNGKEDFLIALKGEPGVGIASIERTNREGFVDTYTITMTNGQTSTFTVTNGKDGENGASHVCVSWLSTKQELYDAINGADLFDRFILFLDKDNNYCRAISTGMNDVYFFNLSKREIIYFKVDVGDNPDELIGDGVRTKLSTEQDVVKIVATAAEMEQLISSVTSGEEGGRYMYLGETTTITVDDVTYNIRKGGVYKLTTEVIE